MWTDQERAIAKSLLDEETLKFLRKVFIDLKTHAPSELEKNIVALDDAEYGRLMKVLYLARQENEARLSLIAKIAKEKTEKPIVATAPR